MADFAGTLTLVEAVAPKGQTAGFLAVKYAVTSYTGGTINLSTLFTGGDSRLVGISPSMVKGVMGAPSCDAAFPYIVRFLRTASPSAWTNVGTLKLYKLAAAIANSAITVSGATGTMTDPSISVTASEASGTITATVELAFLLKN